MGAAAIARLFRFVSADGETPDDETHLFMATWPDSVSEAAQVGHGDAVADRLESNSDNTTSMEILSIRHTTCQQFEEPAISEGRNRSV